MIEALGEEITIERMLRGAGLLTVTYFALYKDYDGDVK